MPQDHLDGLDPASRAEVWRRILEETDPSRGGVLVAVTEGGGTAGFASFGPSRDGDTDRRVTGEVFAIYADAGAWGTGAGRALMGSAVTDCKTVGSAWLSLRWFEPSTCHHLRNGLLTSMYAVRRLFLGSRRHARRTPRPCRAGHGTPLPGPRTWACRPPARTPTWPRRAPARSAAR